MSATGERAWTRDEFFAWAEARDGRYEFDGFRPVAMTGGNGLHNRITLNIHAALRSRLRGGSCSNFGPDLGIATVGGAVRYPDALVTCTRFPLVQRVAPNPVVVFEVVSPSSGGIDRVVKLREYREVASIRRYVIVESSSAVVTALDKREDGHWAATALTPEDVLALPELGIEVPVAEFYEDVALSGAGEPAE